MFKFEFAKDPARPQREGFYGKQRSGEDCGFKPFFPSFLRHKLKADPCMGREAATMSEEESRDNQEGGEETSHKREEAIDRMAGEVQQLRKMLSSWMQEERKRRGEETASEGSEREERK